MNAEKNSNKKSYEGNFDDENTQEVESEKVREDNKNSPDNFGSLRHQKGAEDGFSSLRHKHQVGGIKEDDKLGEPEYEDEMPPQTQAHY